MESLCEHSPVTRDTTFNRRRLLQLSGASLAGVSAGCIFDNGSGNGNGNGPNGTSDGTQTVNQKEVHMLTDYNTEAWQNRWENDLVPPFTEKTGIPVNVEYSGFQGTGEQRLQSLIQSGDTPEMFYGALTQQGQLISEDIALTVNDVIEAFEEIHGELLAKHTLGFGDTLYLVPHGIYAGGTFNYRSDIYDKLSIDGPPKSWDDLLNRAEAIDNDGSIDARGYALPGQKTGKSGSEFNILLRTNDAYIFQWKNESERTAEIWFPEKEVVETLEFMNQLSEFAPDPTNMGWGNTLKYWAGNRVAQATMQNGWVAGVAAGAGADSIAKGTEVAKMPTSGGGESEIDRGWLLADGTTVLDGDNPSGAKRFLEYAYGTTERAAKNHQIEPMRFIPFAESILKSDTYQNTEVFQKYDGHLMDLKMKTYEEIFPTLGNRDAIPSTPATNYVNRFFTLSEMVNNVVTGSRTPQAAYEQARDELEQKMQEGQDLSKGN